MWVQVGQREDRMAKGYREKSLREGPEDRQEAVWLPQPEQECGEVGEPGSAWRPALRAMSPWRETA